MTASTKPTKLVEPPHSCEAEQAVLGSLMIDRGAIARVGTFLQPADFYHEGNAAIYGTILGLANRNEPSDFVTLADTLERSGKLTAIGGAAYLAGLANATPTAALVEHYARIVADKAICRRMILTAGEIAGWAYAQPKNVDDLITRAEAAVYDLRRGRNTGKIITAEERASLAFARYEAIKAGERPGIAYGFNRLDSATQGAQPGQLIIVAGRPSMGKTALMNCIAENMATEGERVLFCTAEQPEAQLTDRSVAGRARISVRALEDGGFGDEVWTRICDALGDLSREPLAIYDDAEMTTSSIRAVATEMRSKVGLDVLVVDYLQLLHDRHGSSDNERVSYISRQLKAIARSLQVPLIVGSQLNRECEDRKNKKPQLSDLRDSGALEQDADVVFLLWRAAYYWPTKEDWQRDGQKGQWPANQTDVIIAKQRQGKRGMAVPLVFDATTMRFYDLEDRYEPD